MKRLHEDMGGECADEISVTRSICSSAENAVPAKRTDNARVLGQLKELAEACASPSFDLTAHSYQIRNSMMFLKDAACFALLCAQRNALSALDSLCATLLAAGKDIGTDALLGTIAFAVCVGGEAFVALREVFAQLDAEALQLGLAQLKSAAQHAFNTQIAKWLAQHYDRIDSNTYDVCATLCRDFSSEEEKHAHVLDFHVVSVHIETKKLVMTALFLHTFRVCATILQALQQQPRPRQLTAQQVQHLVFTVLASSKV